MKKLCLPLLLVLLSLTANSQTVNDIPLRELDAEYVQIMGTSKLFSSQVTIQLDFGQRTRLFAYKELILKDENGKPVSLNSMIDALNFMVGHGYEFVQAYAFAVGNSNVYHYLLKRMDSVTEVRVGNGN